MQKPNAKLDLPEVSVGLFVLVGACIKCLCVCVCVWGKWKFTFNGFCRSKWELPKWQREHHRNRSYFWFRCFFLINQSNISELRIIRAFQYWLSGFAWGVCRRQEALLFCSVTNSLREYMHLGTYTGTDGHTNQSDESIMFCRPQSTFSRHVT